MLRNAAAEAEKKTKTIKAEVQPESGIHNPKTFMVMHSGNPSKQMSGSGSSFQYEERNSMVSDAMEEY